jgi:ribonucleoside-triphosphate reductase (formate)
MVNQPLARARGVKVLKAVSSPLRLQILNLLFENSALSYTELMNQLKLNPSRDAGRFAYHLKFMLKADLVEADVEAKKYYLTDLGKMVLDVADRVEKKAVKPRGMLVRTSHLTVEEFDTNKIANSLIHEAKVPAELAQKAAKEAEKRLIKSKTKYLTAALIREVVNGILVEKGYEEYRHKLTRVGMPVHEVTALIEAKDHLQTSASTISKAGQTVMEEYTLLNVFPRDIADAHLSGAIHIDRLGTWLLKPNEIIHDIRYFFQYGIKLDDPTNVMMPPPSNLKSALSIAFNVLLHTSKETNKTQTFNYFNVSLAPFIKGTEVNKIKENLRLFIYNLNQHSDATLALELCISPLTAQKDAVGPSGRVCGKYGDYKAEIQLFASLLIDVFIEESEVKPLLSPKLVIKINSAALSDEGAKAILLKAHELAVRNGNPYFANTTKNENVAFCASGVKFTADFTGDWEIDTLRTGSLGCVTINLPRITQECEKDKSKFFDLLKERFELSARALTMKSSALRQFGINSLPFLLQKSNSDTYFRLENSIRLVNLAGFSEAVEAFTGKNISDTVSQKFSEEIVSSLLSFKQKIGRKYGKRLYPIVLGDREASERLAKLDVERYGVAKIKFSGTRDKPYYSTLRRSIIKTADPLQIPDGLAQIALTVKGLTVGGSLDILELGEAEIRPETLMELTRQIIESGVTEFFTYNRLISYCENCRRNYPGTIHKCPTCGSMSTLTTFDRFTST